MLVSSVTPRTEQDEEESGKDEEEGIVSAKVIDEDELKAEYQKEMMGNIAVAAVVDEEENKDSGRCPCRACLLVLVLAIVLSIVLPLTIGGDTAPILPEVTSSPSPAPTFLTDYEFLQKVLGPISGDEVWMDETSPQSQALNWLAFEDPAMLPIKDTKASTLIERYALAVLYFSTGGPQWAGSVKFLSNYSVCDWKDDRNEVRCYDNEVKVRYIFIGELSLCVCVRV
jgi:hypothetical protein